MSWARRFVALVVCTVAACGGTSTVQSPPPGVGSSQTVASPQPSAPAVSPPKPAALPEGRIVFGRFATEGGEELLNVVGPGAQNERMIGGTKDCGTCASVSSDGHLLGTLTTDKADRFTFVVMTTEGTERREFPLPAGMLFGPGPFSGNILYVEGFSDQPQPADGIYRINSGDFSGLTQLTRTPNGEKEIPIVVSPDGSYLLFFTPITENAEHGNLFITDTQGKVVRRLNPEGTRVPWIPSAGVPGSFSPDSKRVAFGAYLGDQGQNINPERSSVYVADVAGGPASPIGASGTGIVSARWSPTRDVIAFQRRTGDVYGLYLIQTDGTEEHVIAEAGGPAGLSAWVPVWSPSGDWLAFERGTRFDSDLWFIRPDGSGAGQVTNHPAGYGGVVWAP